jgi:hypothetical protein
MWPSLRQYKSARKAIKVKNITSQYTANLMGTVILAGSQKDSFQTAQPGMKYFHKELHFFRAKGHRNPPVEGRQ